MKVMGVYPEVGMGAIRFSFGRTTTLGDVDTFVQLLKNALHLSAAVC